MAKRLVTRTIKGTKCVLLCVDIHTAEPCNRTVTIGAVYKDKKKLLNKCREMIETDELKVVHIVEETEVEEIRAMSEEFFIAHSEVITRGKQNTENTEN